MLVDVHRDDLDSPRPVVAIEAVERGEYFRALRTPAGPELHQHDLAFEIRQPCRRSLWPAQFHRWRHPPLPCDGAARTTDDIDRDQGRDDNSTDSQADLRLLSPSPILGAVSLAFRDLSFDAASRQVSRVGREVKLTRKAFDLLALLIERRPNAVSKDDIH